MALLTRRTLHSLPPESQPLLVNPKISFHSQPRPKGHLTFFDVYDLSGAFERGFSPSAFNYAENHKMLLVQHFSIPI